MQVYEAVVKGLESTGVDTAFGGNGENVASLMLALKHSSIRPIMTRHEQAASFMACGYAMYTDKLGVCFATVGPGAFNLFSGLAVALSDSYPVLAVTGFVSLDWRGRGAVNDTSGLNRTPEGRPGPVHIHVPQNLAARGVTVDNYHDVRIQIAPIEPDPNQVDVIAETGSVMDETS